MLTCRVFWRRRAEIRHCPVQADQPQQALDEPCSLSERHIEQHLHRQARLDRRIAMVGPAAALSGRRGFPSHGGIGPDRQRVTVLERLVILGPVSNLEGGTVCSCESAPAFRWAGWACPKTSPKRSGSSPRPAPAMSPAGFCRLTEAGARLAPLVRAPGAERRPGRVLGGGYPEEMGHLFARNGDEKPKALSRIAAAPPGASALPEGPTQPGAARGGQSAPRCGGSDRASRTWWRSGGRPPLRWTSG
jgi:hypothetical protein